MAQLLETLGHISGVLWAADRGFAEAQGTVCQSLFGPTTTTQIVRRIRSTQGDLRQAVLFHHQQLVTLLKAALWTAPFEGEAPSGDLSRVGEALLMINDLLGRGPESLFNFDVESTEGKRAWHLYMVANGLFNYSGNPVHSMARSFHLYFEDKAHLRGSNSYLDLPARFERHTGLIPEQLWSVLIALAGHWAPWRGGRQGGQPSSITRSGYLTDHFGFSEHERDRFFDILTIDADELARQVVNRYSSDSIKQFDILPFASKPLVELAGRIYCPSYPLLLDKLSTGLHHIQLDREVFPDDAERRGYLDYIGVVFEDYVHGLLSEAYSDAPGRYVSGSELQTSRRSGKVCDGLILYGRQVIVLEVKAPLLTVSARSGADWDDYFRKINDIVVKAVAQLAESIQAIQAGEIPVPGLPQDTAIFLPIIVTLEPFIMKEPIYSDLDRLVGEAVPTMPPRTRPWQLLHVEELEVACLNVGLGRSFAEILDAKANSVRFLGESFLNYCHLKHEEFFPVGHRPLLSGIFNRLGGHAHEWLASKARG